MCVLFFYIRDNLKAFFFMIALYVDFDQSLGMDNDGRDMYVLWIFVDFVS